MLLNMHFPISKQTLELRPTWVSSPDSLSNCRICHSSSLTITNKCLFFLAMPILMLDYFWFNYYLPGLYDPFQEIHSTMFQCGEDSQLQIPRSIPYPMTIKQCKCVAFNRVCVRRRITAAFWRSQQVLHYLLEHYIKYSLAFLRSKCRIIIKKTEHLESYFSLYYSNMTHKVLQYRPQYVVRSSQPDALWR